MKQILTISLLFVFCQLTAQFRVGDIFSQTDMFPDRAKVIWPDYQLLSTFGDRPDLISTVIPKVGLNYERQLIHNLGIRLALTTNWWVEDKPFLALGEDVRNLEYDYMFWTAGVGLSWHFTIPGHFDPYIGVIGDFKYARASCECETIVNTDIAPDFFAGVRYYVGYSFFLSGEYSSQGNGYVKLGLGFLIE